MQPRCFHPTSFVILNEIALIRLLQIPFFWMKSVTKAKNFIMKLRLDFSINIELQILDQVVTYAIRVASEICNMYKIYFCY